MNPTIGLILMCTFLAGSVWIAILQAVNDGFFRSLWTTLVLFFAYQFTRQEWGSIVEFLTNNGMSEVQAISTGYWIAYIAILAPGMLALKFLSNPTVPFPTELEKYGSMVLGACLGILIFATVIQWLIHIGPLRETFGPSLRIFRPIFDVIGYRSASF